MLGEYIFKHYEDAQKLKSIRDQEIASFRGTLKFRLHRHFMLTNATVERKTLTNEMYNLTND